MEIGENYQMDHYVKLVNQKDYAQNIIISAYAKQEMRDQKMIEFGCIQKKESMGFGY